MGKYYQVDTCRFHTSNDTVLGDKNSTNTTKCWLICVVYTYAFVALALYSCSHYPWGHFCTPVDSRTPDSIKQCTAIFFYAYKFMIKLINYAQFKVAYTTIEQLKQYSVKMMGTFFIRLLS